MTTNRKQEQSDGKNREYNKLRLILFERGCISENHYVKVDCACFILVYGTS